MKNVIVNFQNHFDLLWRRCWERDYDHQGKRYSSYARIERLFINACMGLAEAGRGAFVIEQSLTMRMFLKSHPTALPRLKQLFEKQLFDVMGSGEAIIDVNMCSPETLARNLASGTDFCRRTLGIMPLFACHNDGFGSSAQFPQAIRQCGYTGVVGLSYCAPDNRYWRGLDGSAVFLPSMPPSKSGCWFDHCYHEPCRVCNGVNYEQCPACDHTGLDLPQNTYPPFAPLEEGQIAGELGQYSISSEEMLPPAYFEDKLREWEKADKSISYKWGTMRSFGDIWGEEEALVDSPPANLLSSRVENNPVQTGCYVSRIACKQLARQLEAAYYCWEKALMCSRPAEVDREWLEARFLELPLAFFHDSVTGTQMDEAHQELVGRIKGCIAELARGSREILAPAPQGQQPSAPAAGLELSAFNPNNQPAAPVRIPLPEMPWREAQCLVAVDETGKRFPVIMPIHSHCPALPPVPQRLADPVGPTTRTRPDSCTPVIEANNLAPLAWSKLRLEKAASPAALTARQLDNGLMRITLGEHGVDAVEDIAGKSLIRADGITIGEILLEEDEGDPWGVRKIPAFRRGLQPYTKLLGAARFDGYSEAWYGGRFEPNLTFAKEKDPRMFSLEWYVTVRLADGERRVDFGHEIFWKATDRRLRVAFPAQAQCDAGFYSIPGGWLKRERYEQKETHLMSPNGDWPALYFHATTDAANGPGWAVVNHGTPAARIEDGHMLSSVLRAVGFGHALERYAQSYPMPTCGLRDGGWHRFEFNLLPHAGFADMPRISLLASALNQQAPAALGQSLAIKPATLLRVEGEGIELLAVKPAFDKGQRRIVALRLLNHSGEKRIAKLSRSDGKPLRLRLCNMLEDTQAGQKLDAPQVELELRPFELKSLLAEDFLA